MEEVRDPCLPLCRPSPPLVFPALSSSLHFSPQRPCKLKRGSSGLDGQDYNHLLLSTIPRPVGEAPTLFGGGSPGPHPMTSSQAAGELGWPAVAWRLSTPWGRVRPRNAQCGMTWLLGSGARTSHHGLLWRLAAFLEARPARPHLWA